MAKTKKKDNNVKKLVKINSYLILLNAIVGGFFTSCVATAAFGVVLSQPDITPTKAECNMLCGIAYRFIAILLLTVLYTFINNKFSENESKRTYLLTIMSSITLVILIAMCVLMFVEI